MSTETPRQKKRAAQVLQAAYPDLDAGEVRRLLDEAQRCKRKELRYVHVHARSGSTLQVEPLNFPNGTRR